MTTTRDQEEQDLRIKLMTATIEKRRLELENRRKAQEEQDRWRKQQENWRAEQASREKQMRMEDRKILVLTVAGCSAAFATGAALATLVAHLAGKI